MGATFHTGHSAVGRTALARREVGTYSYAIKTANPPLSWSPGSARRGDCQQTDQWLGGVCGGLATFTGMDAWLWRLIFVLMLTLAGTGLLLYVAMWILVPLDSDAYHLPLSSNH